MEPGKFDKHKLLAMYPEAYVYDVHCTCTYMYMYIHVREDMRLHCSTVESCMF